MTLPLMTPAMPDMFKTGLLVLLNIILATPTCETSEGGELVNETLEFGRHENPAPCKVIVHVET